MEREGSRYVIAGSGSRDSFPKWVRGHMAVLSTASMWIGATPEKIVVGPHQVNKKTTKGVTRMKKFFRCGDRDRLFSVLVALTLFAGMVAGTAVVVVVAITR